MPEAKPKRTRVARLPVLAEPAPGFHAEVDRLGPALDRWDDLIPTTTNADDREAARDLLAARALRPHVQPAAWWWACDCGGKLGWLDCGDKSRRTKRLDEHAGHRTTFTLVPEQTWPRGAAWLDALHDLVAKIVEYRRHEERGVNFDAATSDAHKEAVLGQKYLLEWLPRVEALVGQRPGSAGADEPVAVLCRLLQRDAADGLLAQVAKEPGRARRRGNPNELHVLRADLHAIPGLRPDEADDLTRLILSLPPGRLAQPPRRRRRIKPLKGMYQIF